MDIDKLDLSPAELKAVEDHKYFLSKEHNREITIDDAIKDFIVRFRDGWARAKHKQDMDEQLKEIAKYQERKSIEEGRDVDRALAASEWINVFAKIWRDQREGLEKNGFKQIQVTISDPNGLHMRTSGALTALASQYDCDIYLHKAGMPYFNFRLHGKPYINIKSILVMLSLGIIRGDKIEFISTGAQAQAALEAIAKEFESHAPQAQANS